MRYASLALFFIVLTLTARADEPAKVRVLVWDERQPDQKKAYDNFLGNAIAEHLDKLPGITAKSVSLNSPEQGLDRDTLDRTDVLIWWGHVRHGAVEARRVADVVDRVRQGKLALVALHSAHFSLPFMALMNDRAKTDALKQIPEAERANAKIEVVTSKFRVPKRDSPLTPSVERSGDVWRLTLPVCVFPAWRADGKPSHVRVLLPDHPLAKGLPAKFDIPQTEMYDEPFHVPPPDEIVFEETWDKGEKFRSGSVWKVGKGRVVYFRPGHETYPIYKQAEPLKVIENAARWLGAEPAAK